MINLYTEKEISIMAEGGKILAKIKVTPDHLSSVRTLWDEHGFRTMLFSKLSYGIAQAFLLVAGIVRMPFRKYLRYAFEVAIIEYGILFLMGYMVGGAFGAVTDLISNIIWIVAILTLFITAYYIFTHYMRTRVEEEIQDER
jgi:membrane protein DedA with SNARE-associated domain